MYVHMCAYVSKVYVYSATTVVTAHPSHMFVSVSMYIRMCARWHASAFACVCDTDRSILPVFLFLVAPNVCGFPLVLCLGVVCGGACCGRWVCAQPNVDTGRLVVVGHSLGGYHALRLASGVCMFIYLYIHIDTYIAHMFMCDCR